MTYFAFLSTFVYTCLKTMLLTLWKESQLDMEFTVNREPSLFIKFSIY